MIKNTKTIGIYGGSFNPIHFGHINLAIEMMEAGSLDEIWFCPAAYNPFKTSNSNISDTHRLEMLKLAIADIPNFSITDVDISREGPSYTVETLKILTENEKKMNRKTEFSLILGEDSAKSFHLWKEPEEILKLATVLVGKRSNDRSPIIDDQERENLQVASSLEKGMTKTRVMDISSTDIRNRLKLKKYCGHLVPLKVLDYILSNALYL